jgi:hypothetical protein
VPEDHVNVLFELVADAILKTIAKLSKDKIRELSDEFVEQFGQKCNIYASNLLKKIREDKSGNLSFPGIKSNSSDDTFSLFLARIKKSISSKKHLPKSIYHDAFKELVEIVKELDIKAIYVLVDSLDEVFVDSWIDYIEPLISDLYLMRLPGLAFKFFLPAEQKKEMFDRGFVRGDKLSYAELIWNKDDLQILLGNRLKAFNEAGVDSLRMMAEPQLSSQIDRLLIEKSLHIPRNMMQLGQHLVAVHCQRGNKKKLLTLGDWEQALNEAENSSWFLRSNNDVNILEVGPTSVTVGGKPITLTKLEYDFLWCLAQNNGVSEKDTIIQSIYNTQDGVSDNSLSSLIKRLREKLGDEPKNPRYISTLHGVGFQLLNWQKK